MDKILRHITAKVTTHPLTWLLPLLAVLCPTGAWAQPADGYYRLQSEKNTSYYFCPAKVVIGDGKTCLTTKTGLGSSDESVWFVKKADDTYYYLIHAATGQYLALNNAVEGDVTIKRVHLEMTDAPTEDMLFEFAAIGTNYTIKPKNYSSASDGKHFLNPRGGNNDSYTANLIGFWSSDAQDSRWKFVAVATPPVATPVITYSGGKFMVKNPLPDNGATIRYTTDGSEPTTSSASYTAAIDASNVTLLRAIAVKGETTSSVADLYNPEKPLLFKTTEAANVSYYMIPPLDATTTNVTTSNVPNERMAWLLEPAVLENGTQYYYFKNQATGQYMYCNVNANADNALVMKNNLTEGADPERYRFRLLRTENYYNIIAQNFRTSTDTRIRLYKNGGNNNVANIRTDNDNTNGYSRWTVVTCPANPKELWPFPYSTDATSSRYFKLQCQGAKTVFVYPPTGSNTNAVAATSGNNPEWFFEEAADADIWAPYYYIRNGQTGEYLYFKGNAGTDGTFYVEATDNASDDKYKFIIVRTAVTDESYNIIPKSLKDNPNQVNISLNRNGANLRTWNSRDNTSSQWAFIEQPEFVSQPIITYDEVTDKFSIASPVADVTIYYTTDGSEPTTGSPTYTEAVAASGVTIVRAIATKGDTKKSTVAEFYIPTGSVVLKTTVAANVSYYMMPPLDDSFIYVTTSNVPNARMAWHLVPAELVNGIWFYHFQNAATGEYLYCSGNEKSVDVLTMKSALTDGEADRFKFRLLRSTSGDYYNIIPRMYSARALNNEVNLYKSNGDDHTNTIGLYADNENGYPRWSIMKANPKESSIFPLATTNEAAHYLKIQSVNDNSYYVYPPTGTSRIATAAKSGSNPEWYLVEATDDDEWTTYYYIINGQTGEYLFFSGTNGAENSGGFTTAAPGTSDGYKFIVVRTALSGEHYVIVPKQLRNQPNQSMNAMNRNNTTLRIQSSRANNTTNSNSHWNFVEVNNFVSPPTISYNESTKEVTITSIVPGAQIYYTTDGSEPTTSSSAYPDVPVPLTDNAVNTIKAIAVKSGVSSTVATKTFIAGASTTATGYYALHQNGSGYLKVSGGDVSLSNDGTFQVGNVFNYGNSIWVITAEGYLQNEYYYLNVANNRTLYLDVKPRTRWMQEDAGNGKLRLYINDGANNLYLCNDGGIKVSATTTKYYVACPFTQMEEMTWSGPASPSGQLTLLSPQQLDYLRYYFTQKVKYSFVNDAGTTVSNDKGADRRLYALLSYVSGGNDKGNTWNVADNIIYSKQTEGNVDVTATFSLKPADPIVNGRQSDAVYTTNVHSTPSEQSLTFTLQPRAFTPTASSHYLLTYLNNASNRLTYDDGLAESQPVRTNGTMSLLSVAENIQLTWIIEQDEAGFVSFKNVSSGRYLYFDSDDVSINDYGTARVGAASLPAGDTRYKFRLALPGAYGTYTDPVNIIPYERQHVILATNVNGGRANRLYGALKPDDNTRTLTLNYPAENSSKWEIYPYVVERRVKTINTIVGASFASQTGDYSFEATATTTGSIAGLPSDKFDLEIPNTTRTDDATFTWQYLPDDTETGNEYTLTNNGTVGLGKLTLMLTKLQKSTTGNIEVTAHVDEENGAHNGSTLSKTMSFNVQIPSSGPDNLKDISTLAEITDAAGYYRLISDVDAATDAVPASITEFSGYLDGGWHTVSNLSAPLFAKLSGSGTVRNLNLADVSISTSGNVGAITAEATDQTRIYNVGIRSGSVGSTDGYCGGLVGKLDGYARVINCYSYANITDGKTVGGIVGYNNYATTQTALRTMVMNCMMYGDITGGTDIYPVYGGQKITNKDNNKGVNNYNFYLDEADITVSDLNHYFCSWPVEEEYLTRFDYVRSVLNSNRELCAWWITGSVTDVEQVGKWVYAPEEAKYPILKPMGRYPSVINRDIDGQSLYSRTASDDNEGEQPGTLSVTVQSGKGSSKTLPSVLITDMDMEHYDYGYHKIQLPYYNNVFGDPTSNDHATRYGGNYTDQVVVGWDVVSVTEDGEYERNTFSDDRESGYNFADRNCTEKDFYAKSGRVFAQGGYYYVPEGVTGITIEAHWATAYYCANEGYSRDRIDFSAGSIISYAFTPAGTTNTTFHGQPVYDGLVNAQKAIKNTGGVYDNAIVLVSNVQHRNGFSNNFSINANKLGFTVMSVDLDFDDEPDYALPLQMGQDSNKPAFSPVRFDFVQAPDMGMVLKRDGDKYRLAVSCIYMLGHFEITETSALHFNEIYFGNNVDQKNSTDNQRVLSPIIFNGGQTIEFVAADDKQGADQERTLYIIAGGNAHMRSLYQGNHNKRAFKIKHAPMSVMGGEFEECYLSGNLGQNITPDKVNADSPHLYTNGGRFGIIAGAGQESVDGSVYFQIDHSVIDEFYGGSTSEVGRITGDIHVQIDHSQVGKFCGGPMVGNMYDGKTITTHATGTTFGQFFGAGNGGTSFTLYPQNTTLDLGAGNNRGNNDKDWGLEANYKPMEWANNMYKAKYHFEIWQVPSGTAAACASRRYIYGAQFAATKTGNVTSTLKDCIFKGDFYGGGNLGAVVGDVTSTLTDCEVKGSVYGAGFSATIPSFDCYLLPPASYPWQDPNTSICHDYKVGDIKRYTWTNEGKKGETFTSNGINYAHTDYSLTNLGSVSGDVTVNIDGTTHVAGSVYGGGALASSNTNQYAEKPTEATSTVNLKGGVIDNDVYGGGLGRLEVEPKAAVGEEGTEGYVPAVEAVEAVAALVGNTVVNLNEDVDDAATGCVVKGNIFGCNNLNGTPKGTATVHVFKTQHATASRITNTEEDKTAKVMGRYDLKAVYGGGNLAAYEPASETAVAAVIVDGCDRTSIQTVYGGGNAASTPATSVTIKGTYEIDEVFGGGNGKDKITRDGGATYIDNPGANVGYHAYDDDLDYDTRNADPYPYGTGEAWVNINGGTVHSVFGGSNTKGNVRRIAGVVLEELSDEDGQPLCNFNVDEAYGGGKMAQMDGEARLVMRCMPGLKTAYGGAEAADISGGVTLNIANGTYERVFGGNNRSGSISGPITVNIEETGCRPIVIGQLYGGGNLAAYTAPTAADGPTLNIKSCTAIGEVYGGGLGTTATVTGDTHVNINEVILDTDHAKAAFAERTITIKDGDGNDDDEGYQVVIPARAASENGAVGVIGTVYGGGNAAEVDGDTYVNIGTAETVEMETLPTVTEESEGKTVTRKQSVAVSGANVAGNVFGGGYGTTAVVTGNTHVTIGR